MKKINFHVICIDDDQYVLNSMNRLLRCLRPEWQVSLVQDPSKWLEVAREHDKKPDLIISDLWMANFDGYELLQQASQNYPGSIRVLITGDVTKTADFIVSSLFHFMLPKPFSEKDFSHVLSSVERLHSPPFSTFYREKLLTLQDVPILPSVLKKIRDYANEDGCNIKTLATIVSQEPSLVARLIQVSNSAYLGYSTKTTSLNIAIMRLGVDTVETIADIILSQCADNDRNGLAHKAIVEKYLSIASLSKKLAKNLNKDKDFQDKVYLVALLSSLGKLMLLNQSVKKDKVTNPIALKAGYKDEFVIGNYILSQWGYDVEISDAVLGLNTELKITDIESITMAQIIIICRDYLNATVNQEQHEYINSLNEKIVPIVKATV